MVEGPAHSSCANARSRGGERRERERHVPRQAAAARAHRRAARPRLAVSRVGLFAAHGVYDDDIPGAGAIAGIGRVRAASA
jgi:3-methylcrotonyl-CoA carboxylase beta subunit